MIHVRIKTIFITIVLSLSFGIVFCQKQKQAKLKIDFYMDEAFTERSGKFSSTCLLIHNKDTSRIYHWPQKVDYGTYQLLYYDMFGNRLDSTLKIKEPTMTVHLKKLFRKWMGNQLGRLRIKTHVDWYGEGNGYSPYYTLINGNDTIRFFRDILLPYGSYLIKYRDIFGNQLDTNIVLERKHQLVNFNKPAFQYKYVTENEIFASSDTITYELMEQLSGMFRFIDVVGRCKFVVDGDSLRIFHTSWVKKGKWVESDTLKILSKIELWKVIEDEKNLAKKGMRVFDGGRLYQTLWVKPNLIVHLNLLHALIPLGKTSERYRY
jgi:hypothetical protein